MANPAAVAPTPNEKAGELGDVDGLAGHGDEAVGMRLKSFLAVAVTVTASAVLPAGVAFGGEIKGLGSPTGIPVGEESFTAAPAHTNSICAFSGLNHFHEGEEGQLPIRYAVQRAARRCWLQERGSEPRRRLQRPHRSSRGRLAADDPCELAAALGRWSSLARPASVVKWTRRPCWQAQTAKAVARCGFPLPLSPTKMMLSRSSIHVPSASAAIVASGTLGLSAKMKPSTHAWPSRLRFWAWIRGPDRRR
jgi:hypothetical protein